MPRRPAILSLAPALALLVSCVLACAVFRPYFMVSDAPKPSELERVLVLPFNFDSAPSPLLVQGIEALEERVVDYLSRAGVEVGRLPLSEVTKDWRSSQREVGGLESAPGKLDPERYEAARSGVVRRGLERRPGDAAVVPTLLVREARLQGFELHWDGVTRLIHVDQGGTPYALTFMRGTELGTSLRITVYDRTGRKVFERYAGLEPMVRYATTKTEFKRIVRSDLFEDEDILASGVRTAFSPWLEPDLDDPDGTE